MHAQGGGRVLGKQGPFQPPPYELSRLPAHSASQELQRSFESQLALLEEVPRFGSRESLVEGEPSLILPWRV